MGKNNGNSKKAVIRDKQGRIVKGSGALNPTGKQAGTIDRAKAIKLAFMEVFERVGGVDELVRWVNDKPKNKADFYKMLLSILPKEIDLREEEGAKLIFIRSGEDADGNDVTAIGVRKLHQINPPLIGGRSCEEILTESDRKTANK